VKRFRRHRPSSPCPAADLGQKAGQPPYPLPVASEQLAAHALRTCTDL
jgi:hypothetical protein